MSPSEPSALEQELTQLELRVGVAFGLLEAFAWGLASLPLAIALVIVPRVRGQLIPQVLDLLHIGLSGVVAAVALRLSRRILGPWIERAWLHYVLSLLLVLVLGGGLELVQFVAPGTPSLRDLAIDLLGGMAVLAIAASRSVPTRAIRWARLWRSSLWAVALTLLLVAAKSPLLKLLWQAERARAFPVVLAFTQSFPNLPAFARPKQSDFLELNGGATLRAVDGPSAFRGVEKGSIGELQLPATQGYPGLELEPARADWERYQDLMFDVYSPAPKPVTVELRIDDTKSSGLNDRFNKELVLIPGVNTIRIDLRDVKHAPKSRALDLRNIRRIVLFAASPEQPVTLLFDPWRLELGDAP